MHKGWTRLYIGIIVAISLIITTAFFVEPENYSQKYLPNDKELSYQIESANIWAKTNKLQKKLDEIKNQQTNEIGNISDSLNELKKTSLRFDIETQISEEKSQAQLLQLNLNEQYEQFMKRKTNIANIGVFILLLIFFWGISFGIYHLISWIITGFNESK